MKSPIVVVGQVVINLNNLICANPFEYEVPDETIKGTGTPVQTTKKVIALSLHMIKGRDIILTKQEDINQFLQICSMKGYATE